MLSFMIYAERVQSAHQVTSQISYVRSVAEVSPYALLLFGGELSADYIGGEVCIDNWIRYVCNRHRVVKCVDFRLLGVSWH